MNLAPEISHSLRIEVVNVEIRLKQCVWVRPRRSEEDAQPALVGVGAGVEFGLREFYLKVEIRPIVGLLRENDSELRRFA